ncbi:hypothetical protein C8N36_10973 [Pelagimonas varians]|uniref:Uncharacterized protein n=1 Tax=Pelagimonas varians TaxID=696760 RepID=A0A238KL34_9RHOB|nr:hypothetical protein [Pelagimonas varians]PYG29155.1 hypothetical protein C8N36_10973 [Pelagimonas varians]SMX43525.1 hypothetical protein PEV8663_02694 [Pelagimonas varians]
MQAQRIVLFGFVFNKAISQRPGWQGEREEQGDYEMSHAFRLRRGAVKFNNMQSSRAFFGWTFDNRALLLPDFGGLGQVCFIGAGSQRKNKDTREENTMSAKFITGVITVAALIAAIAAAPAQARNNDDAFKKFVIGAGTIYLLHELVNNQHYGGNKKKVERHGGGGGHGKYGRHGGHGAKKAPIPRRCIRKVGGRDHTRRVANRHCLKQSYRSFNRLPSACKTRYRQHGEKRKGYGLRCLRNHGFRVSGRH